MVKDIEIKTKAGPVLLCGGCGGSGVVGASLCPDCGGWHGAPYQRAVKATERARLSRAED